MSNKRFNRSATPTHELSDKSKLMWERYYGPMQAAANQLNAAIGNASNMMGEIILKQEGFSPETHVFDIDKLVIVPRPKGIQK